MKVVDVAIQRTLDAIAGRDGNVMLGSHDSDFVPQVEELLDGDRRRRPAGLPRARSAPGTARLVDRGLELFDLEDDARCFNQPLPRLRIIPIEDFDPALFL